MKKSLIATISSLFVLVALTTPVAASYYDYNCDCMRAYSQGYTNGYSNGYNNRAVYNAPIAQYNPRYNYYPNYQPVNYNQPFYSTGSVWGDFALGVTGALIQNATYGNYNYDGNYFYSERPYFDAYSPTGQYYIY